MSDRPIDLARFRERKAREERKKKAAASRAQHGLSKRERARLDAERAAAERQLEGRRREPAGVPGLETERLVLRAWRASDRPLFAALNADPDVVRYLPRALTRTESDATVDRIEAHFREHGFGLWAVEVVDGASFIGFVGLSVPAFDAPFTRRAPDEPCVEVGWRLAAEYWGRGYAPEAARAALDFAFETLALPEVVSFTVRANRASRRVMEKLGLTHDPADDFDHPALPEGDPLRRHVLYRMSRERWLAR